MADHGLLRSVISLITKHDIISIGTKYFPTTPIETEYVDMFNYTQTMLMEIDKAHITTESIFTNLVRDVGRENIPENHSFYELLPAQDKVEEYALVSNIIMGSDRYMYIELSEPSYIINYFTDIIIKEKGEIIERSETELVSKLMSKNDAIRVAIKLVGIGLDNGIRVRAAAGMTGAAAIERSIKFNKEVGDVPGVAFTKLGGEYALVLDSPFTLGESEPPEYQQYLFIDIVNSTDFISKHGRNKLVELMTSVKEFMEDCDGKIEGYREGGDDLIARFPSKDVAIRAGLDCAWFILNNGAKVKIGIGRSRREAGERANIAEGIKGFGPLSLVVFDLANGLYAYNVPSDFSRTLCDLFANKKGKLITAFLLVFILSYLLAIMGMGIYGFLVLIIIVAYYTYK
ncbi:hypothetical protein [uncultured Methanobrevibacter sp.]|uniref:hypothetical protein n=1 Tax=uncultured Methanobrevibacter sp. TaxID=253161 RepID=UPI00263114A9